MKFILLITITIFASCTPQTQDECTEDCNTETETPKVASKLEINHVKSDFYSESLDSWQELEGIDSSISVKYLGIIPIKSYVLSISKSDAIAYVTNSDNQVNDLSISVSERNKIPFLKFYNPHSAVVNFNYIKYDEDNKIVSDITSKAINSGSYSYIPFINELFNGKMIS